MCGGEEEGGSTLVEEDEDEDEEQGTGPGCPVCGLTDLLPSPLADWTSRDALSQDSDAALVWLPSPAIIPVAPSFSLVFLASRRRRLVARDDEGEEVEEVDVMELGLVFLGFSPGVVVKDDDGAARMLRFPPLVRSLLRPPRDSGSEHGLRNGDLLSLSLQNTTAMEPPTTELPAPPPVPPDPRRSMLSFPAPTEAPVVLLTPSRTSTDTLDWSFPFRLLLLSFLDFPERHRSFLLPLSRSLSFPILRALFTDGNPGETEAEPEVTVREDKHFLVVLLEEGSDFCSARDFFFGRFCPDLVMALGLGMAGSGGRAAGGVSSKEG